MINNIRSKFENKSPTFYRGKKKTETGTIGDNRTNACNCIF